MGEDMAFCIVFSFWSLEEVRITQCLRYFVGCNNLGMFPFPRYDTSYPEAVSSELLAIYRLKEERPGMLDSIRNCLGVRSYCHY